MFGDEKTHNNDTFTQAESFINRFGPGMIVYWFGHAPLSLLNDCNGDIVIVDSMPVLFMLPSGDVVSYGTSGYWGGAAFYSSY